ncbi:uncharacterized protein F4807DRAFT_459946 [Annulohypoxylon truncatum]|uniref:uncharacterized protein n=1 Tax=Annulohypoxylon truncatum TaxID=327061 RepID=UPI0020085960|nr:uncharacterized protein F4807DRAFT_459946 [Annulohypoxylon truncatum]KAI1210112.1 hypothetical protein F4807DRAFT_459946 [Annulohypoxylon truncatum]
MNSTQWLQPPYKFTTPNDVLSVGISLPIICIVLLGLRFYARRHHGAYIGIDDWLIALGVLMITAIGACMVAGERLKVVGYPTPVPSGTTTAQAYGLFLLSHVTAAKLEFAVQILMCFAFGCIKTSIIFFSRRIFIGHKKSIFDKVSWALIALSTVWSITFLFVIIFGCGKNVPLRWAPIESTQAAGCDAIRPEKALITSNFVLDLLILGLPLPTIWTLNMSPRRKLATTGIFLVGFLSLGAAITRVVIFFIVSYQNHGMDYDTNQTVTTMLWLAMLESCLAAIASCLPTLTILGKNVRFRKLYYRLGGGAGLLSFWKPDSGSRRWPRPSGDNGDNNSYAFASMDPTRKKGNIVIERQISVRRDGLFG